MPEPDTSPPPAEVRRCDAEDWRDVRRLHLRLALGLPMAVDVDLNEVLATPVEHWRRFVAECSAGDDQALFVAVLAARCVGMGHVRRDGDLGRLDMLYVDPGLRRRGIGTGLVWAQERWAADGGAAGLVCHIPDTSPAAEVAEALEWRRTDEVFVTRHRLEERRWTKEGRLRD